MGLLQVFKASIRHGGSRFEPQPREAVATERDDRSGNLAAAATIGNQNNP